MKITKCLFISIIVILLFLNPIFAFIEQTRIVTSDNQFKDHFKLEISLSYSTQESFFVKISGDENEVADLSNPIRICLSEKQLQTNEIYLLVPTLLQPSDISVKSRKVARILSEKTTEGRIHWSVAFEVDKKQVERTYIHVPPPTNVSDGCTYIIDLPDFLNKFMKGSLEKFQQKDGM
jgi:hypothetical protein